MIGDRLVGWLGRVAAAAVGAPDPTPVSASVKLREAGGVTVDADEDQWRKLTGDAKRDLAPMTQTRMQSIAAYLWESNNLANRLIELPLAYLLAEGVNLTCQDPEHQRVLDRFWDDPINRLDERLPELVRSLALMGELALPVFVNELLGRVRFGFLDSAAIDSVITHPDNPSQPIGIITVKDKRGRQSKYRVLVLGSEADCFSARVQDIRATFTDGECFYFCVNKLAGGSRGRSDLLSQADWCDGYDNFLFGELDRAQFLRSFLWDVTLNGATPAEVEQRAKQITTPAPGSVRVHNDSEKWEALAPGLQAADLTELARMIRNHALGGKSVPEHWFGGGGDVNRAVGAEMSEPTLKDFSMRQRAVKLALETIGRFVLMNQIDTNPDAIDWSDPDWKVEAVFPEMSPRDTTKYASALQQVVVATGMAVDAGVLTQATALKIIAAVAGRLGIEIDAEQELAAATAEAEQRAADQAQKDAFQSAPLSNHDDTGAAGNHTNAGADPASGDPAAAGSAARGGPDATGAAAAPAGKKQPGAS